MAIKDNGRRAPNGAERSGAPFGEAPRPDPEVLEKAKRRQFPADFKLRVLEEADACREPGAVAAQAPAEGAVASTSSARQVAVAAASFFPIRPRSALSVGLASPERGTPYERSGRPGN